MTREDDAWFHLGLLLECLPTYRDFKLNDEMNPENDVYHYLATRPDGVEVRIRVETFPNEELVWEREDENSDWLFLFDMYL